MAVPNDFSEGKSRAARSLHCSGQTIATLRDSVGFTQAELARRAGYSTRLIRKAESGGSLARRTIRDLADALSTEERIVSVKDLVITEEMIAKRLLESLRTSPHSVMEDVYDAFAADASILCSGDPSICPFAGSWHGTTRLRRWFATLQATLGSRLKRFQAVETNRSKNIVFVWGGFPRRGEPLCNEQERIALRFQFQALEIRLLEIVFDSSQCRRNPVPVPMGAGSS
ncbi:helix-turn-helix domain-containing protein [Aeoliella mucimassa]|uniref:HTH cro/C1-type domain-containing protein n=1 Tax=Aeoliella mucimassa TaxID=2527972 RepID=A0A518AM38_9BACT|nr:helix-turn-helix transcriptional regulator [Aeoliella mucimassa]QDU55791.1 hypothetical protein Pan181_19870 [Aeoliella mucimassa]